MSTPRNYLAIDLGAESGRAIVGRLDGDNLHLQEAHRFRNRPVQLPQGLMWNVLHLWSEIKRGIALASSDAQLDGIGLDAWGVDYALLDNQGGLVGNPFHHRDSRTDGMVDAACQRLPRETIFEHTGIQFMQINTLYQLFAMVQQQAPALDIAKTFLTIPDLFNYWLTGQAVCEFSIASTSQCFDPRQMSWARPLLEALDIPHQIFPDVIQSGTVLGSLRPSVANECDVGDIPVIAPACHDTGSAAVAIPAQGKDFAWISSGTWSVLGAELPEPVINAQSLAYNFTNEGGVQGTFRLSKNIMGLWLVQECRRTWKGEGENLSYGELTTMAQGATPFRAVIDPDHDLFLKPGDMPERIRAYCAKTGQSVPQTKGEIIRCVLQSIALKYRLQLERLEELVGRKLEPIHIVGGGTQNRLLSQFTAQATGRVVLSGPIEATAMGNILMQAMALGHINSLSEARAIVRHSTEVQVYEPDDRAGWDEAYERLRHLIVQST
ncbi:MAG: rhamnulokinase [Chloroflexi bacterium]|nr:rhamnulokinase [Chloroflexota bacterium]